MSYVVCIPSYNRATLCNEKTLKMLKDNKIPKRNIYVYVASQEEYDSYKAALSPAFYNNLVVGVKGLIQQRQFITEQWPEGKNIVFFDDDVASVDLSMSDIFKGQSLDFFFREAFKETKKRKSYIWGVYPVFNPFFRKARQEITTCLTYIVGAFYGVINRPKLRSIELTLFDKDSSKEDVLRSILYFVQDGIVVRFNRIGFITKYYGKRGGLGTFQERLIPMRVASEKLKEAFPNYGDIVVKKTGMTEFKLKKICSKN